MGLLDKAVDEIKDAEKTKLKNELNRMVQEEKKKKTEEEFAHELEPYVKEGLREFPEACRRIGVDCLPLLISRQPTFFNKKEYHCLEGYYLCPRSMHCFDFFMTKDGRYYQASQQFTEIAGVMSSFSAVKFSPNMPMGYCFNKPSAPDLKDMAEDEAVPCIAQYIVKNYLRSSSLAPEVRKAAESEDYETIVAAVFADSLRKMKSDYDRFISEQKLVAFYESLKK